MTKHSTQKLPRLYKTASKIVQQVKEEGGSVKTLVYGASHPNLKALYALVLETLKQGQQLDYLIRKTEILLKNPRLNPWVARVLMTELLWQKKALSAVSPPLKIVQSYQEQFLSELANFQKDEGSQDASNPSDTAQQIRYVRVNTIKDTFENVINWFISEGWEEVIPKTRHESIQTARNLSSYQFMRDVDIPNLLIFPHDFKFYETELYSQGVILLQDKASCVPPILLHCLPGSTVLDMCAAPGMKTSQIAALIDNKGKVNAVEINKRRYETLRETVEKSGALCVNAINGDVLRHSGQDMPDVEFILLDPPCSGSGMQSRKHIFGEVENKDIQRLAKLANFQCSLLRHAMTSFPSVKRIVYSTCSVHPEENEAVVDSVLKSVPPNFVPSRDPPFTSWMTKGSSNYEYGSFGFYAYPSAHVTNGFYVIVFERSENEYVSSLNPRNQNDSAEGELEPQRNEPKKKKRKKKVAEGENGLDSEEKCNKTDDVVSKMLKAMQKKSETDQPESIVVEDGEKKAEKEKKKKIRVCEGGVDGQWAGVVEKYQFVEEEEVTVDNNESFYSGKVKFEEDQPGNNVKNKKKKKKKSKISEEDKDLIDVPTTTPCDSRDFARCVKRKRKHASETEESEEISKK